MNRKRSSPPSVGMGHSGTTLSEILVSLLVMSIGVVSLATLFPISVLRAVQATQLTNSANLRYNVEALLGVRPELFSVGPSWVAGTPYASGALVSPMTLTSLKSPPAVFLCTQAGNAGTYEPAWNFNNGQTTNDGTAIWKTFRLTNYVVDPLGEVLVETAYRQTPGGDYFGNDGTNPSLGTNTWPGVRAFTGFGSPPTVASADDVATLPDSWITQAESASFTATATQCTLNDLREFLVPVTSVVPATAPGLPITRIVLFDITGKVSHTRLITSTDATPTLSAQNVYWTGSLPSGFTAVKARIELRDRRYTWMLSVRRAFSGASYMDVVVFFKRRFSGKDEQTYPATFTATTDYGADGSPGVAGLDDDGNGTTDDTTEIGWPGSDDVPRNWVVIQYDASGDKPFVKKGGFVTDLDNLRWYRIIDIVEGNALSGFNSTGVLQRAGLTISGLNPYPFAAPYQADGDAFATTKAIFLRVEGQIDQSGSQPTGGLGGAPTGRAMVMRGVVDVYPIRTHLSWEN